MTLRKTFEGDFKKTELTWGTAENEAKDRILGEKGMAELSLTKATKEEKDYKSHKSIKVRSPLIMLLRHRSWNRMKIGGKCRMDLITLMLLNCYI